MIRYPRPVRLEDIDTAQIVFFGRFSSYAHEALEAFFAELEGGYVALVGPRGICFATVRMESDFQAPLRYGDTVSIETTAIRLGNRSATLQYRFVRNDGTQAALFRHTIVATDMKTMTSCPMPDDVRALITRHLTAEAES